MKNQKLFLEDPDPGTGFQAYSVSGAAQAASDSEQSFLKVVKSVDESFGLPDPFWNWLSQDVELRQQFEKMIETRASAQLEKRFEELREQVVAEAEAKGYEAGLQRANDSMVDAAGRLNGVIDKVLDEKTSLLRAHEVHWGRAFAHLLSRFLIGRQELAADGVQRWLNDTLSSFERTGRIVIHLSPKEYAPLSKALQATDPKRWEIISDPVLKPGEIHCECEGGGIFFSAGEEMKKLEQWIDRFVSKQGEWAG